MALYEKHRRMPPYLAEIPYGFKNLWLVSVSAYDLGARTFLESSILSVTLNGQPVTAEQMKQLYDYNRDACSLSQSGMDAVYVTLNAFDQDTVTYTFTVLVEQDLEITGVLSVAGDMVDLTDPLHPIINHDDQKLDANIYEADKTALESRLTADEAQIQTNTDNITALQGGALVGVTVNGEDVPVNNNIAQITIDNVTSVELDEALALKVDKTIAGIGETIVKDVESAFDNTTDTLSFTKTALSLETGDTTETTTSYPLADLLGITTLVNSAKTLTYFYDHIGQTLLGVPRDGTNNNFGIPRTAIYGINADGTKFTPTTLEGVQTVYALIPWYYTYGTYIGSYVGAIIKVISASAEQFNGTAVSLISHTNYSKYNRYYPQQLVYSSELQATFEVIQYVPEPLSESTVIPLTNELYFRPTQDYSLMDAGTIWANLEAAPTKGNAYTLEQMRIALIGENNGYNDYVSFKGTTVPTEILNETDWNNNVNYWVTDGKQFLTLAELTDYLSGFTGPSSRFKTSNLGIISTQWDFTSLVIAPIFTAETISTSLTGDYQPIPTVSAEGNIPVYDVSNILVDSGKSPADFATAAQGDKADSAVQNIVLSTGTANGTIKLTVDGNDQTASVFGLGSAAYTNSTAYATSAQGALADSALQTAELKPGTTNGSLILSTNGIDGDSVTVTGLGTAAYHPESDFATSAQGALADSSIQTVSITTGDNPGTIKYSLNGEAAQNVAVADLGSAAYTATTAYATAAQGALADSALQSDDVVDNLNSTSVDMPLSANQGRILSQQIEAVKPSGKPIGGFQTYAERYTNTSQYASDLQPINVGDTIYIAADENFTNQPTQYRVSSIGGDGTITYSFMKIVPDIGRDFVTTPIRPNELADGAVNSNHIQNGGVATIDIANNAVTNDKLSTAIQSSLTKADNSFQANLVTNGTGSVVTNLTQNADKTLTVTYGSTSSIANVVTSGDGLFVTSGSFANSTLTLDKNSYYDFSTNYVNSGYVVTSITEVKANNSINIRKGGAVKDFNTTGTGNVIGSITKTGTESQGYELMANRAVAATSVTADASTGNVVTDMTLSDTGALTYSKGLNAVTKLVTSGTGDVLINAAISGDTLTVTKGNGAAGIPDASTTQKGIVQLNNTLTSDSVTEALTAAQGKALKALIDTGGGQYVSLNNNETVGGIKTFEQALVVPSKTTLNQPARDTEYATEAQVFTRVAKPTTAVLNNVAIFDANRNIVDSGIANTLIAKTAITTAEIESAFNEVFA